MTPTTHFDRVSWYLAVNGPTSRIIEHRETIRRGWRLRELHNLTDDDVVALRASGAVIEGGSSDGDRTRLIVRDVGPDGNLIPDPSRDEVVGSCDDPAAHRAAGWTVHPLTESEARKRQDEAKTGFRSRADAMADVADRNAKRAAEQTASLKAELREELLAELRKGGAR